MTPAEPISATVPVHSERHSGMEAGHRLPRSPRPPRGDEASAALRQSLAKILPPLPPPPDPPGTAYVAAVLSGALSPRPTSPQEMLRRVGEWQPPTSDLHLADKLA